MRKDQISKINIARLLMSETGTYNDMVQRPYTLSMEAGTLNSITQRAVEMHGKLSGATLSGVACDLVSPSAAPTGNVSIPNGWGTRRIRFVMEVHCQFVLGVTMIYYIQGYTDFPGVSATGEPAPDMRFIINSIIGVSRTTIPTPSGMVTRDIITENSQVVADPNALNAMMGGNLLMRPQDVFGRMQANYISQGHSYGGGNVIDPRGTLTAAPVRSNRMNNVGAEYIAKIVNGYTTGNELATFGQGTQDILSRAKAEVYETPLMDNPFISILSDVRGMGISNSFTYGDLLNIDPGVSQRKHFAVHSNIQQAQVHTVGATSYWNGTDRETVVATILGQAVPALMMELLISKINFHATNHDHSGNVTIAISGAKSLTEADMTRYYEMFKSRLANEVLRDISFGGNIPFSLQMEVDLFGDTWIRLSLNSGPIIDYALGTFSDSLFTPIVTGQKQMFDSMVYDIENLVNNVSEAVTSATRSPVVNNFV